MSFKPYLRCNECRELKPRDDFPDKVTNATGKRGICLTCAPAPEPEKPLTFTPRVAYAMCQKKTRYKRQATALSAALRSAKRAELMRVYECPICKGWHLTHKEARAS